MTEKTKKSRKGLKIFGGVVLALVIIYAAIALWPRGANFPLANPMMKDGELPILIAHGRAAGGVLAEGDGPH